MISCGCFHSLALTKSGREFGWGDNEFGALGVDSYHAYEPIIIDLNSLKIQKISCGHWHSVLLSYDGDIYALGGNRHGEIGNGTREKQGFPIKLELDNKFIDIASHPHESISMAKSIDGIYYVWGYFEGKNVLSSQPTEYESFEDILRANNMIDNIKTLEKLIEFEDPFVRNGFYSKNFIQLNELGKGSFGTVFKVKVRDRCIFRVLRGSEYSAIKRIELGSVDKNEMIKEFLNYSKIRELLKFSDYSDDEYLIKCFNIWFEESVVSNQSGLSLYIEMELCNQTLDDVIKEFDKESLLKTINSTLTTLDYYIAGQIFLQTLGGVNYLHKQNPPIIHRDLKPANILLKKCSRRICVKIADFGLFEFTCFRIPHSSNYATKSDVHSLGVIFQNLFALDLTNPYDVIENILKSEYKVSLKLCNAMTVKLPNKRPSCEEILKRKTSWALFKEEFVVDDNLKRELIPKLDDEYQFIFSILNSKLNI